MAYSEILAERVRKMLGKKGIAFEEKQMMGGLAFMVDNKMCMGISHDSLMARINPEFYEQALKEKGAREMDFTGHPMKGFLFINPDGVGNETDLEYWVQQCLDYNPVAPSSKTKKK